MTELERAIIELAERMIALHARLDALEAQIREDIRTQDEGDAQCRENTESNR